MFTGHRLRTFLQRFLRPAAETSPPAQPLAPTLRAPTQCALWADPELLALPQRLTLELVESYVDSSHLERALYKCPECGQLYFYEYYEWVDWKEGNDKQYITYFPVERPVDAEKMNAETEFGLLRFYPRLHWNASSPYWHGK